MKSGSPAHVSISGRSGSLNVTARRMRSPKRSMTTPTVPGEQLGRGLIEPRAARGEPVRRREVVERHDRRETAGEASVDERFVVRERLFRELALDRLDARPLDREAVGVEVHAGDEVEVGLPQLPAVRGLARTLLEDGRRHVLEEPGVAVDVVALVLVTGGGDSPEEVGGEAEASGHEWSSLNSRSHHALLVHSMKACFTRNSEERSHVRRSLTHAAWIRMAKHGRSGSPCTEGSLPDCDP